MTSLQLESEIFDIKVAAIRMLVTRSNGEGFIKIGQTKVNS